MSIKDLMDNPSIFPMTKTETMSQTTKINMNNILSPKAKRNTGSISVSDDNISSPMKGEKENTSVKTAGEIGDVSALDNKPNDEETTIDTSKTATESAQIEPSNENKVNEEEDKENMKVESEKNNESDEIEATVSDFNEEVYRDNAKKLFKEEFVTIEPEEYTRFLAANDEESLRTRQIYMDLFEWDASLLVSTRMLCSKLYLKGESQEIDRILSAFTKSYVNQHKSNIFCTTNFEKIYIILYSLILLNTSLHNGELNKRSKIGQTEYIRNTFTTFVNQNPKKPKKLTIKQKLAIEKELCDYYDDLARNELYLKQASQKIDVGNEKNKVYVKRVSDNSSKSNLRQDDSESPVLSRQASASSIWSSDTSGNRRSSLYIQPVQTGGSGMSNFSSRNHTKKNHRVGLARALVTEQNQKNYSSNNSFISVNTTNTLRNHPSLDPSIMGNKGLFKKSSRASVISRDTIVSNIPDDNLSVTSFTNEMKNFNIDAESPQLQQLDDFDVDDYQDQYDLTLELEGSPYLKEGLLKSKIINDDQDNNLEFDRKSTSNESRFLSFFRSSTYTNSAGSNHAAATSGAYAEHFVVVSKGELSLYSFDPKVIKKHQQKLKKLKIPADGDDNESSEVGDGNWLKNAAKIGTYNLCSTYAQFERHSTGMLLSTSAKKKSILWSLSFPKVSHKQPKKVVFEAGTKEIALEFINTCNFWASKITAIPTNEESISSIEYGWNNIDKLIARKEEFKKMKNIQKWEPLPKGVYLSNYVENSEIDDEARNFGMMKQFVKTVNYYNNLRKVYQEFNQLKLKFISNFKSKPLSNTSNYSRIMVNYENKSNDYLLELRKYKNYLIMLGFGLQLRFDLQDDELNDRREEFANDELEKDLTNGDEDDGLKKSVKIEIYNLFTNLKAVEKIIPNYHASKSINSIIESKNGRGPYPDEPFPLVKSPKTFTLSNYNSHESPIAQLLQTPQQVQSGLEIPHSYSTRTIKEEEELEP